MHASGGLGDGDVEVDKQCYTAASNHTEYNELISLITYLFLFVNAEWCVLVSSNYHPIDIHVSVDCSTICKFKMIILNHTCL